MIIDDGITPNVYLSDEYTARYGNKSADLLADGEYYEVKEVSGTSSGEVSKKLSSRILDAGDQAPNILIDGRNQSGLTRSEAVRSVERAYGNQFSRGGSGVQEVTIVGDDFVPYKLRYEDYLRNRSK